MYADYAYYKGEWLGDAIAKTAFSRLIRRASERVDYLTRFRAAAYYARDPTPIKNAVCAVAEVLLQSERGNALLKEGAERPTQTEIVAEHHVTYALGMNTAGAEGQAAMDKAVYSAAAAYLMPTGLLYRGVIER